MQTKNQSRAPTAFRQILSSFAGTELLSTKAIEDYFSDLYLCTFRTSDSCLMLDYVHIINFRIIIISIISSLMPVPHKYVRCVAASRLVGMFSQ